MLDVWRENVYEGINELLMDDIKVEITEQRKTKILTTDRSSDVQATIKSLIDLGLEGELEFYKKQFEIPFLEHIAKYYSKYSKDYLEENSISSYAKEVEQYLKFEEQFIQNFLNGNSEIELLHVCNTELVGKHLDKFFDPFKEILYRNVDNSHSKGKY